MATNLALKLQMAASPASLSVNIFHVLHAFHAQKLENYAQKAIVGTQKDFGARKWRGVKIKLIAP